jgi:LmbE family N-acetylglucosaminyl deacetylase
MGTLLAVFAHPDDEFSVGPLLAKYAALGHDVWLATITSGQQGSSPNANVAKGPETGRLREEETRCAAGCLGIREPVFLGFEDQGISTREAGERVAEALRGLFARLKPDVVVTFGPEGVSGHPDHRAASNLVTEVCAAPARLGHLPARLYYVAFPESRCIPMPPPFRHLRCTADSLITTVIDCREHLDAATAAVRCHRSQWDQERAAQFDALNRRVLEGYVYLRLAFGNHHRREGELFQVARL